MNHSQEKCQEELEKNAIIPRKYYGQVFTTNSIVNKKFVQAVTETFKPGSKIVEIGGGLGYLTETLAEEFDDIDVLEYDAALFDILNKKFIHSTNINLIQGDILEYEPPERPYMLVGNIPFHLSGRLYRRFMSELKHKPYAMVFITDKQYATTLMGQPPRSYRVSLQAQAYGDIKIVADVPPSAVYPEPKVMSCIMKISQNNTTLPENFWKVVNYHWENFPTIQVKSPKTMGLEKWVELAKNANR